MRFIVRAVGRVSSTDTQHTRTSTTDERRAPLHQPRHPWMVMLAAVLWGTVGVTTQGIYRLTATNPFSVGFFRMAIAAVALGSGCSLVLGWHSLRIARRDVIRITLMGFMLAQYQACYFAAIARVGVALATLVTLCLAPVIVAGLSGVLLHERPNRRTLLALVCALAGITCIVAFRPGSSQAVVDLGGIVLAVGSALGYAVVVLAGRSIAGRYHPLQINTVAFGVGALALLPLALATGFVTSYPASGWLLLLYLGLVPTAVAYALFLFGMRATPASAASILTLLEPLTATLLAAVLFGERLDAAGWVGAVLLLGAMILLAVGSNDKRKGIASPSGQI